MQSSQRNRRALSCQARLINRFEMPALNNSFVTETGAPNEDLVQNHLT